MTQRILPHGSWPSPISADELAHRGGAPNWPTALGNEIFWTETRPAEGGRVTVCRKRLEETGEAAAVLPSPWNVRSRVYEYGGQPYVALRSAEGTILVFSEFSDQRLYCHQPDSGGSPVPLTPEPEVPSAARYVEPIAGPGGDEVWCLRELHTGPAPTDVTRALVAVPLDGSAARDAGAVRVVASGPRFLACPRVSPDGRRLSWIGWDHPNMPWDSTFLYVAEIAADGTASGVRTLAGGDDEAVVQAEWSDGARLYCVTDPSGWWNPHRIALPEPGEGTVPASAPPEPVNLARREEEFGGPLWQVGQRWLLPLRDGRLATLHGRGALSLGILSPDTGNVTDVGTPHTEWTAKLTLAGEDGGTLVGIAASPDIPAEVVAVSLSEGTWQPLNRTSGVAEHDPHHAYFPCPRERRFTGPDGREIHANLYPPHNPDATAPGGELPPYVVWAHGGPTGRAPMVRDREIAYFTSRGLGVVEVNYGGSTGYGRAYRERLRGNWGVVDVQDCVAVARALGEEGVADPQRLAIRGGSAGGWTTAAALAFTSVFQCGVILCPIVDLVGWRTGETHDFESQYLETLVGPWPQERERYEQRSPVNHADSVTAPFVLLQGLEDEICPPVQCERFLAGFEGREVPHAYLAFAGEQHGFRKAETVRAAVQAELSLYAQVLGFETDAAAVTLRSRG